MTDPLGKARAEWFRIVESLDDGAFDAVRPEQLPPSIRYESLDWEQLVFRPGTGPSRAGGVGVHATRRDTLDLLRYDYRCSDVRVTVTESSQFLHVRFRDIPEKYGREPIRRADALAAVFLSATMRFQADGAEFSSAPAARAASVVSWSDRVDGRPLADGIALLVYKLHPEKQREVLPRQWFDDEFRKKHAR